MDQEYLVAQHLLVVNDLSKGMEIVAGEYLDDGTPKLRKVGRTIHPGQIFKFLELDADPTTAREIADGLVNDVPDWCRDIPEDARSEQAAARWATDVEVLVFSDQQEKAHG